MVTQSNFEPRILGFLCNWCAYAGADLAGVSRFHYPPNLRVIRVLCSGRVDPVFILDAFLKGMDGVFIGGCHLGDCHYLSGNYEAVNTVNMTRKVLEQININSERLLLDWISAAEGIRFAEIISGFTQRIKELGPLGFGAGEAGEELQFRLKAAKVVVGKEKIRWITAKQSLFMDTGNEYGEKFTQHEMTRVLDGLVSEEQAVNEIMLLLEEESLSVLELARRLNLVPARVLNYVAGLRKKGMVTIAGIRGSSPLYTIERSDL